MSESTAPLSETVREIAEQAIEGFGLYVVDVHVRGQQGSRAVTVYVDSEEGAGLDDIAEASRAVSEAFDLHDPIKGRYRLDVSSPGADRPLTDPRQYRRHIGRTLEVQVRGEDDAVSTVSGTLEAASETSVTLDRNGEAVELAHDRIASARVALPW